MNLEQVKVNDMQVLGSHRKQEEFRGKFQQLSFNPKA